jgi:hypothetical protein
MAKRLNPDQVIAVMIKAGLKPLEPYKISTSKWKCKCLVCGNTVTPTYKQIASGSGGCRTCRYKKSAKSNSNSEVEAIALMLKNKLKPLAPYQNKDVPWKSLCLVCKKIVNPSFGNIKRGQTGCKWCSRKFIDPEEASIIMRKQGYEPLTKYVNDRAKWKSRCLKCKKISYPTYAQVSRQKNITGCTYCNAHYINEKDAIRLMIKAKLIPLVAYKNARTAWKCRCLNCNKIVTPTFDAVSSGKRCGYCAGNKVDAKEAKKIMLAAGYEPLSPYKTSKSKWICIHIKCGREVNAPFERINSGNGACRYCANSGFQHGKRALLYLITHPVLNAHKVGIGNPSDLKGNDRIEIHKKYGWLVHRTWEFKDGKYAQKVEKEVLRVIRKEIGLPVFLSTAEMPQAGHTETVGAEAITLLQLTGIINKAKKEIKN